MRDIPKTQKKAQPSQELFLPEWSLYDPKNELLRLRKLYKEERRILEALFSRAHFSLEFFSARFVVRREILSLIGQFFHLERVGYFASNDRSRVSQSIRRLIELHSQYLVFDSRYLTWLSRFLASPQARHLDAEMFWYISREVRELRANTGPQSKLSKLKSAREKLDTYEALYMSDTEKGLASVPEMLRARKFLAESLGFSSFNAKEINGLMMADVGEENLTSLMDDMSRKWKVDRATSEHTPGDLMYIPRYTTSELLDAFSFMLESRFHVELERSPAPVWSPDVLFFRVYREGELLGGLYIDLLSREGKFDGSWSGTLRDGESHVLPLVVLSSNLISGKRANHHQLLTLFHEGGHALHHLLARPSSYLGYVRYLEDDAIEIFGRFFERFAFEEDIVRHIFSRKKKSLSLRDKRFLQQLAVVRRYYLLKDRAYDVAVSLFDWRVHRDPPKDVTSLLDQWQEISRSVIGADVPDSFPSSMKYVFGGTHSAKFILYIWSDIIAAQLYERYARIRKKAPQKAEQLMQEILHKGSSASAMDLLSPLLGKRISVTSYLSEMGE